LVILFWPFASIIFNLITKWNYRFKPTTSENEKNIRKLDVQRENYRNARAVMMETCTESSFQPLLQLFLVLPCIINQTNCYTITTLKLIFVEIIINFQIWSIFLSMLSLSLSFSFFCVHKSRGALQITSCGFIILFLQFFAQIFGRIVLIVMVCHSAKSFYWTFLVVILHMAVWISLLFCVDWKFKRKTKARTIITNLLANIYIQIWISDDIESSQRKIDNYENGRVNNPSQDNETNPKHLFALLTEMLILIENVAMITFILICGPGQSTNIIFAVAICSYFFGLGLKLLYYSCFYIWKHTVRANIRRRRDNFFSKLRSSNHQEEQGDLDERLTQFKAAYERQDIFILIEQQIALHQKNPTLT